MIATYPAQCCLNAVPRILNKRTCASAADDDDTMMDAHKTSALFYFLNQMSMTAGLLCLYGLLNLVPGVYELVRVTTDGQDWSGGEDTYPPVVLHLASLIQVL